MDPLTRTRPVPRDAARRRSLGTGQRLAIGLLALFAPFVIAQDRVVSTDASITAVIEALGESNRLVGIDVTSTAPTGFEALPRVGYHRALSTEGLLSLRPDLLLASEHAGPASTLEHLSSLGVAVLRLSTPLDIATLTTNIEHIGQAFDRDAEASALASELTRRADALRAATSARPRTLLIRRGESGIRVAGAGTAGAALLELLGVQNIAHFSGYRGWSQEALLAADPELLIVAAAPGESTGEWLTRYPLLRHLQAVREQQLLSVDAASLVGGLGPATLREAERLQARIRDNSLASLP